MKHLLRLNRLRYTRTRLKHQCAGGFDGRTAGPRAACHRVSFARDGVHPTPPTGKPDTRSGRMFGREHGETRGEENLQYPHRI